MNKLNIILEGGWLFYRKLLYVVIVTSLAFSQYEYSLEDVNPNSATFGTNVWYPDFSDYITLHYFGTQGWQGWTSIFWQLSDFQEILHEEQPYTFLVVPKSNISYHKRFRGVNIYPFRPGYDLREWWVPKTMQKYSK